MRLVILSVSSTTEQDISETMAATTTTMTNNTTVIKITESVPIQLYGRVILSLENCLLPQERLESTPSSQDGLDKESETELRVLSCEMIQTAGILLKLPQVAMATGQVLFHRFYYSKSLVRYNYEVLAMGCVCLASKIEEAPRRIRDVINVFHYIKQLRNSKQIQPMILDQNYLNLKNQVIKAERRVLKELGFCVHVKHPHKVIVMYLQVLECKNERLTQLSWNYMNDSLRTDVFLRYTPETIACACIYLSARKLQLPLPNKPAWYSIFRVDERDIRDICHIILKLYTRPKSNIEKLEKIVDDLKRAQDEAKLKAKGISLSNTPQGAGRFSPNSRSSSPHKADKATPAEGGGGKDDSKSAKKNGSPRASNKEQNHAAKNESPSSNVSRDRKSGGSHSSKSRSRSRSRKRTPPRGYKGTHKSTSRSRSKSIERKKRRTSKRNRRSRSHSYNNRSPHRNHKKSSHREKIKYRSRSRDRNYRDRSRSRSYDKYVTKGRKEKSRDNGHHRSRSYERSRR